MKRRPTVATCYALVLLLSACSSGHGSAIATQAGEAQVRTVSKLTELPPDLRDYLLDRFDVRQTRRTLTAEVRALREREIITDERRWFEPACTVFPGYSTTLFVRAIEAGRYWIIQYQFGGIAHGAALLVLARDATGKFQQLDRVHLHGLEARPDEIVDALKRAQQASIPKVTVAS